MFKNTFKYYKRKVPPPDLTSAIDFSSENINYSKIILRTPYEPSSRSGNVTDLDELGLIPICQWKIYELISHPGLIYVVNPFTSEGQRLWISRCLSVYPRPPNKINLHAHGDLSVDEDWWHICLTDGERKESLYKKLRWVTLGYHHNWDTKVYDESERGEFPEDLRKLSCLIVKSTSNYDLEPEAAIVNYYNIGSTLSGHTDHSELNHFAPLPSFSFGQEAVFLIGGRRVKDDCEALLVKSGDIIVMSGDSRLSYHGVPLVRRCHHSPWTQERPVDLPLSWQPFQDYILTSRININVRQVLHPGCRTLNHSTS